MLLKEGREGKARQPLSGSEEELPRPQDARREKVRGGAEQARYGSVPDFIFTSRIISST